MFKLTGLPRLRLSTRLGIGVVALVLASTFVIAAAALFMVKETIRTSIANEQFARITSIGDAIDQKFASRRILLKTFGESAEHLADPGMLQAFLQKHTALTQAFSSVFIVERNGTMVASLAFPELVGVADLKSRPYIADTLRTNAGVISQPFENKFSGAPQLVMTEPVFAPDGTLLFIVVGTINLQERSFLGELANVQFGKTGYMFILNTHGIMIDHPQKGRILKPASAVGGSNLASQRALEGYEGTSETTGRDGVPALYAYKRISQTNWIVAARYPSTEAFEPLRRIELVASIGALGVALLSGSIALAVMRRQLAPLALLHQHMRAAQAAPVHVPMPAPFREDEIGDLARTLDLLLAQRQASADQLLAHGRFLRTLADSLPVLIAYIDTDQRYRFVNSTFVRWTGADTATVIGQRMEEVLGAERYQERLSHLNDALAGRRAEFEISIDAPNAPLHVQTSYVPDLRPDGSVAGVYCLASDVTAQKQVQGRLRDATREADQANLAKSQFLANMSHEIRTPMNAVVGLTYLLGQSVLDARQADMVSKLRIAGKSLLGVINDVLDLSKIEAGELTLEKAPFALDDLLTALRGLLSLQASAKGIALTIDSATELPVTLEGDATRLGQILTNLVSNAIKFTDRGSVELSVSRLPDGLDASPLADPVATLRFAVRDSGIGIAPEVQARLFSPFVQADASTKRRFGGTGLGLSIVKRLVSLMDGRVGLESVPGIGSTFWVELALPVVSASAHDPTLPEAVAACDLRGVRVLITDDSEINLEVASRILLHHGAQVTTACDGQQAVDVLAQRPGAFDVVLMDVQMPVLDGYEATQRIRDQLGLTFLPVIALTAGALIGEQEGAAAAGMNDFIGKPFEAKHLVRTVWRHARRVAPDETRTTAPKQDSSPAWPAIPGIDTADVQTRLGGDVALFGSLLRRLLHEFSGVGRDLGAVDVPSGHALAEVADRMHKLKGSASALGATGISRLADRAETACRTGRTDIALARIQQLAAQLEQLGEDASPVLGQAPPRSDADRGAPDVPAASEHRRLKELVARLNEHNISAVDRFREMAPNLRRHLGDASFERLRDLIEDLQFRDAVDVLEPLAQNAADRG